MPLIQPDTSEALDMSPMAAGTYKAKITAVEFQTSKKGNPMIVPKFEMHDANGKRRVRQAYLVVNGEGAYGFDQLLRACHFTDIADQYKDKAVQPKPQFDTDQLIGQELQVVIVERIRQDAGHEGEKGDNVQSYLPV